MQYILYPSARLGELNERYLKKGLFLCAKVVNFAPDKLIQL